MEVAGQQEDDRRMKEKTGNVDTLDDHEFFLKLSDHVNRQVLWSNSSRPLTMKPMDPLAKRTVME